MTGHPTLRRATLWTALALAALTLSLGMSRHVLADGAWLDQRPLANWNKAGEQIPLAMPVPSTVNPQCATSARPPETDEDRDVAARGWLLVGTYQGGYGVLVITGTSDFDGMCRPMGFQTFVFYHGTFIGTISPDLMNSRTDGVQREVFISPSFGRVGAPPSLSASFSRYSMTDPLCCPSATSSVEYRIEYTNGGWVLVATSAMTSPNMP
jgi:hypothetical protein